MELQKENDRKRNKSEEEVKREEELVNMDSVEEEIIKQQEENIEIPSKKKRTMKIKEIFSRKKAVKDEEQREIGKPIVELQKENERNKSEEEVKRKEEFVSRDSIENKQKKKQEENTDKQREKKEGMMTIKEIFLKEKAEKEEKHRETGKPIVELLKENQSKSEFNRLALPVADGLLFIEVADIILLEAEGASTHVWLKNGTKVLVSKKLRFFEDVLEGRNNFFRPHRSYLINFNYVSRYSRAESTLLMDNKISVPVSKEKKSELEASIKNIRVGQ